MFRLLVAVALYRALTSPKIRLLLAVVACWALAPSGVTPSDLQHLVEWAVAHLQVSVR
jgi:hypothetical protein